MGFAAGLIRDVWESVANRGLDLLGKRFAHGPNSMAALCHDLLSERGEASGAALARKAGELYARLSPPAREAFFLSLLDAQFLPDQAAVIAAAERYKSKPDSET